MLRVSAMTTESDVDIQAINGNESAAAVGVEFGPELMKFAESVASGNEDDLEQARQALLTAAGPEVLVDAAGVAANFQRMVRIADAAGIPVDDMEIGLGKEVRAQLDLDKFATAQNSFA